MSKPLNHICILVKDIDQAIQHYTAILKVAAPEYLQQKVNKIDSFAGQDKFISAFFRSPEGGCDIQLMQPVNQESPLYKRLQKHGEGLHHMCFGTPQLEKTYDNFKANGVTMRGGVVDDVQRPGSRWTWIEPQYANGVLIEVIDTQKVPGSK